MLTTLVRQALKRFIEDRKNDIVLQDMVNRMTDQEVSTYLKETNAIKRER